MVIDSELSNDGVILGSFGKRKITISDQTYDYYSGFNYGQTSRGHDFFHSMGKDGEHCFVKSEDEMTKKRVVGIDFENGGVNLYRFDYLNDQIHKQLFTYKGNEIEKSDSIYLGSSPSYFRGSEGDKLFSGKIEKFLVFSGKMSSTSLSGIARSLVSNTGDQYYFTSGAVTTTGILSGYITQIVYKTGVTGSYAQITGYQTINSGVPSWAIQSLITGTITGKEGDRIYTNSTGYIGEIGYLNPSNEHTYSPTGYDAHATLGLQNQSGIFSGYAMSGSYSYATGQIPLYQTVYLTGVTSEISGVTNTAVYITGYKTGDADSGVIYANEFSGFKKNLIYYLGDR